MPDARDFYYYMPSGIRAVLQDMAELAVRLGSIVSYSRTGQVIKIIDSSNGLSDTILVQSAVTNTTITDTQSEQGGYAIKLSPFNASAVDDCYVAAQFAPIELNKWGLEVSFAPLTEFELVKFYLRRSYGGTFHEAIVLYTRSTHIWSITKPDATELTIGTLNLGIDPLAIYHHVKLVVDFDSELIDSLTVDNTVLTVRGLPLYVHGTSSREFMLGQFRFSSRSNNADVCNLAHMIITTGE